MTHSNHIDPREGVVSAEVETGAAAAALGILQRPACPASGSDAIRPFRCSIQQKELDELRRRVLRTACSFQDVTLTPARTHLKQGEAR